MMADTRVLLLSAISKGKKADDALNLLLVEGMKKVE